MKKLEKLPRKVKLSLLALTSLAVVFLAGILLIDTKPTRACGGDCGDFEKVTICHANPPDTAENGWNKITPASIGALMGHVRNDDADVIPPFGQFPGKNWTGGGQAIWNNDCKELELSPTPTPEHGFFITINRPGLECGTNYVKFHGDTKRTSEMYIKFIINGSYPEVFYGADSWYTGELTLKPGDYTIRVELWLRGRVDTLVDSQDGKFTIEECRTDPTPTDVPGSGGPSGGGGGPAGAPSCNVTTPGAPRLLSATYVSHNSVRLVWQKVAGATHYSISYGPTSGNYPWGVPNTGDTNEFVVGDLTSTCFIVRAVNDCAPSDPSNEVCTGQVAGQVLGLSATSGDSNYAYIIIGFASILFGTKLIRRENFI